MRHNVEMLHLLVQRAREADIHQRVYPAYRKANPLVFPAETRKVKAKQLTLSLEDLGL